MAAKAPPRSQLADRLPASAPRRPSTLRDDATIAGPARREDEIALIHTCAYSGGCLDNACTPCRQRHRRASSSVRSTSAKTRRSPLHSAPSMSQSSYCDVHRRRSRARSTAQHSRSCMRLRDRATMRRRRAATQRHRALAADQVQLQPCAIRRSRPPLAPESHAVVAQPRRAPRTNAPVGRGASRASDEHLLFLEPYVLQ